MLDTASPPMPSSMGTAVAMTGSADAIGGW